MASKVDASGSSQMGDVHMLFRISGSSAAASTTKRRQSAGTLRLSNLAPETTEADISGLLGRYYSTVREIKLASNGLKCQGHAQVTFGMEGERDRAIVELQGTMLRGSRITLSKHQAAGTAVARKRDRDGSLLESEIHAMLLERETCRRRRDYVAADGLVRELKQNGVLVDVQAGTWRASDGRTGILPSTSGPAPGTAGYAGGAGGYGSSAAGAAALDDGTMLYVRLDGGHSIGTHTLQRILAPFDIVGAHGTHDGFAALTFASAASAANALALPHYGPTGREIKLLSPRSYRELTGQPEPAAAAAAWAQAQAALPAGWTLGWSAEYGQYYYTHAERRVTQWDPPPHPVQAAGGGLVDYDDDEDDEAESGAAAATTDGAAAEAARGWFYGDPTGQVHGPFSTEMMLGWVHSGALPSETPVCREGSDGFVELAETPELMAPTTAAAQAAGAEAAGAAQKAVTSVMPEAAAKKAAVPATAERTAAAVEPAAEAASQAAAAAEVAAPAPSPASKPPVLVTAKGKKGAKAAEMAKEESAVAPAPAEAPPAAAADSAAQPPPAQPPPVQPPPAQLPPAQPPPAQPPAATEEVMVPPKKKAKCAASAAAAAASAALSVGGTSAATPSPAAESSPSTATSTSATTADPPALSAEAVGAMKVTELKAALKARGLDQNGKKAQLVERLLTSG